jgi:hypothetical protein
MFCSCLRPRHIFIFIYFVASVEDNTVEDNIVAPRPPPPEMGEETKTAPHPPPPETGEEKTIVSRLALLLL